MSRYPLSRRPETPLRRAAGWTLWETVVALNVLGLAILLVLGLFSSMEKARHKAYARQVARVELQENLEALAQTLRHVDLASLDGFDAAGVSRRPRFTRAIAAGALDPVVREREELRWMPVAGEVPGISRPGQVVHVHGDQQRIVAENVPQDAFSVRWESGMLVVEVATYQVIHEQTQVVRGSTSILVRN